MLSCCSPVVYSLFLMHFLITVLCAATNTLINLTNLIKPILEGFVRSHNIAYISPPIGTMTACWFLANGRFSTRSFWLAHPDQYFLKFSFCDVITFLPFKCTVSKYLQNFFANKRYAVHYFRKIIGNVRTVFGNIRNNRSSPEIFLLKPLFNSTQAASSFRFDPFYL